ncbi:porin [Sphingosinicella terrae]|uniref:porin n=1 Tax=Sphingosinicella terrae TaxID=2172047 RepID=UPI000E0DD000|nr:porin [Sphingosinicella terrae]
MAAAGSASLIAMALMLAPAFAQSASRTKASRPGVAATARPIGAFTPAVSDPRLAAALARRGTRLNTDFRFTPASNASERNRSVRVAIRARASTPAEAARTVLQTTSASPVTAITPSSYNLGVSLGWRRFAVSGDVAQAEGGVVPGRREAAQVGMSYRANRRLTGRVAVAAERADGAQQLVADDEAYSLDVGGAFSITRNVDVTAGARYRIARDRLEPMSRDERRDSQAVYVGTAFRF